MVSVVNRYFDSYYYGNSGYLNNEEHPSAINVCAKYSDDNGEEQFSECTLVPDVIKGTHIPLASVAYGAWRIAASVSKIGKEPAGDILGNMLLGVTNVLTLGLFTKMIDHLLLHHSDDLKNKIVEKNIGIIAVGGEIVASFPLKQVDLLTSDTAHLTDEIRLRLLVSSVKAVLEQSYILNEKDPLPIKDLLRGTYSAFNFINTCKYDIAEIKNRIKRLKQDELDKTQVRNLKDAIGEAATIINRFVAEKSFDLQENLRGLHAEVELMKKSVSAILENEPQLDKKLCQELKEIALKISGIVKRFAGTKLLEQNG